MSKKFEFVFPKGYLKEVPGVVPGSGVVRLDISGFTYFHVTHTYRATLYEPEDYDGYDVEYGDIVSLGELLIGDEFEMCNRNCRIEEDMSDRIKGFADIVMKYFRKIFSPLDACFLSKIECLFYDENEIITAYGDGDDFFNMIPRAFWGNKEFKDELGQYMWDIASTAIDSDDDFRRGIEEDERERYLDAKADYDYDRQQEAAEDAYYDALDRLGL